MLKLKVTTGTATVLMAFSLFAEFSSDLITMRILW